jgi:nucleotide-binding universal stress UspA family protein
LFRTNRKKRPLKIPVDKEEKMTALQSNKSVDIIIAVDGSDHAIAATEFVRDLPLSKECSITLIAVLDTPHTPRRQMLLAALNNSMKILQEKNLDAKSGLLHGNVPKTISDYADDLDPDIIVLGAKGLRATLGILLGGVAQQVVEYACCPTLVVRAPYIGLKRILLVTDGSSYSQSAVEYITHFPFPEEAALYVTHVLPPTPLLQAELLARTWPVGPDIIQPVPADFEEGDEDEETLQAEQEAEGKKVLEQACDTLTSAGIEAECVLLRGDAATEIIDFVQENAIDLIVCGSRGLSQVQSWLLGSVSRKLVHYANCSVLIVKS